MIRFTCPKCGNGLKVSTASAGKPTLCRRCGEVCVAPTPPPDSGNDRPGGHSVALESDEPRRLFAGMSRREQLVLAFLAGIGALVVLLAMLPAGGITEAARSWAVPVAVCSGVLVLITLHGHATNCPACGRWWARKVVEKGYVSCGPLSQADGGSRARSVYRTTYECRDCEHRWSVKEETSV